jgi:hypothetical protein
VIRVTDAVEIALIVAVAPTVASVAALVVAFRTGKKTEAIMDKTVELNVKVDGRLDQLLQATNAQGRQDERDSRSIVVEGIPKPDE